MMDYLLARLDCPVLRQLCGTTTDCNGYWSPGPLDAPLRAWLHAVGIDSGLGVGFTDDNPGYRSGLTLDRWKHAKLAAPKLHNQPLPAIGGDTGAVSELQKLQHFATQLQHTARTADSVPPFEAVVEMLRDIYKDDTP